MGSITQPSTSGTGNESEERRALREQLLGEDASRALAFQTVAVKHFGADGGIFIRQLLYRDGTGKKDDFWIYKSMAEWEEETGLQRRGQERARKRLIGAGVMEEKKATIHGRRTLHFRVEPWKLMEVLGDELPHAKPLTSGLDCTLKRTGSMSVNRTGSMSAPDRDHADSRQGITEDHSEEVSPLSPPNGAPRGSSPTSSRGVPSYPAEKQAGQNANGSSPRRRSRSGGGTPDDGLDRMAEATHARLGYKDLKGYIPIARRWDFNSEAEPPWWVMKELDNDYTLLKRIQRVVRDAEVDAPNAKKLIPYDYIPPASPSDAPVTDRDGSSRPAADQQTAQAIVDAVEIEEF